MTDLSAIRWRKSRRSSSSGANCVEVGPTATSIAIRDTKDREGPAFLASPNEWSGFINTLKSGAFDL